MSNLEKPLGRKNYGKIPHLSGSRLGPSDKQSNPGHARIATVRARDKYDEIFVQEKLDGSNVGVVRMGHELFALGRAGYNAFSSPHEQHQKFAAWVYKNYERFMRVLFDGERLVGEWLLQAHGTRYKMPHEPFVAFDLMIDAERMPYDQFTARVTSDVSRFYSPRGFIIPALIHRGGPISIEDILHKLPELGHHGALEPVEGAVWRVERDVLQPRGGRVRKVDFLTKYVRPDKVDGCYLDGPPIWNTYTGENA